MRPVLVTGGRVEGLPRRRRIAVGLGHNRASLGIIAIFRKGLPGSGMVPVARCPVYCPVLVLAVDEEAL